MPDAFQFERTVARVRAFPLASEAAFRLGLVDLEFGPDLEPVGDTDKLATALERELQASGAGVSIEVLRQVRSLCWLAGGVRRTVPIHEFLASAASELIEQDGAHHRVRAPDGDHAAAVLRWRWMSLQLPPDLLVASMDGLEGRVPTQTRVGMLSRRLQQVLTDQPVAETHLHVGAGTAFATWWPMWMGQLAIDPPKPDLFDRGNAPPFGRGDEVLRGGNEALRWVLVAAIIRTLLASFLQHRDAGTGPMGMEQFLGLSDGCARATESVFWRICTRMTRIGVPRRVYADGLAILSSLLGTIDPPPHHAIRRWYAELVRDRTAGQSRRPRDGWGKGTSNMDPLATVPGCSGPQAELRLAARIIHLLHTDARGDTTLARLFWQYQRIRCRIYRWLVERPETAGLDWFTRHYDRIKAIRPGSEREVIRGAWMTEAQDLRLASFEIRTAPEDSPARVRDQVLDLAAVALQRSERSTLPTEAGLVLHLVKARVDSRSSASDAPRKRGRTTRHLHADPAIPVHRCRYGVWFRAARQRGRAVEDAIKRWPFLLLLLRGVDIANLELAIPTWVYLPILRGMREASRLAARRLTRDHPEWGNAVMGCTLHLGEEYRRLVEGLRRIHEPVEFGLLGRGDRIGHGLALGDDPDRWCRTYPCVPQPLEERLDDLLWELDRYEFGDLEPPAGRVYRVLGKVRALSKKLYCETPPRVEDLREARRLMHDPQVLRQLGYPYMARWRERDRARLSPPRALVVRRLVDVGVFRRGVSVVAVRVDRDEAEVLHRVQRWLRGEVASMEIAVESNPSSNLVVGDLASLEDHPAFRLSPARAQARGAGPEVHVSVNSDDPLTFATRLADEYAYAYAGLAARGVGVPDVQRWLDTARRAGWYSRFTLAASANPDALKVLDARGNPRHLGIHSRKHG